MEESRWVGVCSLMSAFLSGCLDLDSDVCGTGTGQLPGENSPVTSTKV